MKRGNVAATQTEFEGKCGICGDEKLQTAMTTHLSACLKKEASGTSADGKRSGGSPVTATRIVVEGVGFATYWLQLAVRSDATLRDIDRYLRETWLECSGHMSAFRTAEGRYFHAARRDHGWRTGDSTMDVSIAEVLPKGVAIEHDYDFGSTTTLRIRNVAKQQIRLPARARVLLLARNFAPHAACASCDKKAATRICGGCWGSMDALVCEDCGPDHECGEEMLLPLVNSPRTGVCGYTGDV